MEQDINDFLLEHDEKTTYKQYFLNKWEGVSLEDFNDLAVEAIITNKVLGRITPGKVASIVVIS